MALMPKRVKYRKSQKGRVKGNATRGNYVAFGEYGLQSLEPGRISSQTIEAGRVVASHAVKGGGKLFIHLSPQKRHCHRRDSHGKGKGEVEYWAAVVKPGTILYEISGLSEDTARSVLARVAQKMPVTCRFVTRRPTV
jgi:large subunit ribosomal protein L16